MLLSGGSRTSHHLRECHLHSHLSCRYRYYSFPIVQLSFPSSLSPSWPCIEEQTRMSSSSSSSSSSYASIPSDSPREIPSVFYSFSQQEDDQEIISDGSSPIAGGVVALGKFDALYIGHRELAIQASKAGPPFLLSFCGMAKVLGWERSCN